MALVSKVRPQGGSIAITVPTEAARRMGVSSGDELYWIEDGSGGYRVSPVSPEREAMMKAHAAIMSEYRDTFAALAK